MGPRLPRVTGSEVLRALRRGGWYLDRQHGSHIYLKHPKHSGKHITVAIHSGEIIKPKTFLSILKQAELSIEEFQELL